MIGSVVATDQRNPANTAASSDRVIFAGTSSPPGAAMRASATSAPRVHVAVPKFAAASKEECPVGPARAASQSIAPLNAARVASDVDVSVDIDRLSLSAVLRQTK